MLMFLEDDPENKDEQIQIFQGRKFQRPRSSFDRSHLEKYTHAVTTESIERSINDKHGDFNVLGRKFYVDNNFKNASFN